MTPEDPTLMTIAVIGGTGKEGSGLAMRWAMNGYRVIIGSRDGDRAAQHAKEINQRIGDDLLAGMSNPDAAAQASLVVLSVPYQAHHQTLESIKDRLDGKILLDITVPLQPPNVRMVHLPEGKAAALEAQAIVGENVRVVSAFQHISWEKLQESDAPIDSDVLVTGDAADAKADVMQLVEAAGMRPVDAGSLANSIAVEAMGPVLLYINRKYGVKGSGLRITGIG